MAMNNRDRLLIANQPFRKDWTRYIDNEKEGILVLAALITGQRQGPG